MNLDAFSIREAEGETPSWLVEKNQQSLEGPCHGVLFWSSRELDAPLLSLRFTKEQEQPSLNLITHFYFPV